ncbi:hypothetical protein FRC10_004081, partial [Ceratobasidium sp. 414]
MTFSDDRYAQQILARGKAGDATELQRKYFPDLHPQTVRRHLHELGLMAYRCCTVTRLSEKVRKARHTWAKGHRFWEAVEWSRVIFSDESRFNLFSADGPRYAWRYKGQGLDPRYTNKKVAHGGGSVMVWGCITAKGVGRLYRIDGIMTAKKYTEILSDALLDTLGDHQLDIQDAIFQQDNDPKHKSHLASNWFKTQGISVLPWPSYSPDMNIIEHVWSYLDRKVRSRCVLPRTTDELWEALKEEWENMDEVLI